MTYQIMKKLQVSWNRNQYMTFFIGVFLIKVLFYCATHCTFVPEIA